MARERFRVILWGAGTLMAAIVRQLRKRPDFEIVGMLCYSAEKGGRDIGELLGIEPLGLPATINKEEIFALDADCAIVAVKDSHDYSELNDDVVRLLESGKNVVSTTSFFYPPVYGREHAERLLAACRKGGASLHGAGEHPSTICERLALTLTGFCTKLDHVTVHEYADIGALANPSMLHAAGIGRTPAEVEESSGAAMAVWGPLFKGIIGFMAYRLFDAAPESITMEATVRVDTTDHDFSLSPDFVAPAGTAVCVNMQFDGKTDGRHFITLHFHWAYGVQNAPVDGLKPGQTHHVVEVEGEPISVRMTLDGQASFARDVVKQPDDPTIPIYYLAVGPIIQSIPVVCRAEPGFVYQTAFSHFKPDYR